MRTEQHVSIHKQHNTNNIILDIYIIGLYILGAGTAGVGDKVITDKHMNEYKEISVHF